MEKINFEDMPSILGELLKYVRKLEAKIDKLNVANKNELHYNIEEAADFLNLKQKTIYNLVNNNQIAYCKPSKKLYFLHQDLMAYIKNSRCQSRYV
jgi:excisionase family DNA binding protein